MSVDKILALGAGDLASLNPHGELGLGGPRMPSVARTMLCGAILVTVAYIGMCLVYVTGPVAGLVGIGAAAPARAQPSALAAQPVWQQQLAPIMQQSAVPTTAVQPAVVSMGPCCADLPSALARAVPASAPKMVLVTFCNAAFKGMLLNFAEHLRRAHIPHVIGAVDREAFELMQEAGSPTYLIDIGHVDGSSSHSGASWKKFAVTRTEEVAKVVALGYSVIMTDVDVLWLRDPIPYFVTCGAAVAEIERQSCTEIMMADVLASSDNLSPGKNLQQGLGDAYWGTFNTGIVVIRATEAGKAFAQKWH
ncbi:nucleotide-diphospho-sugar transferase-domain-containing protein, partial [Pavlovales sp. CCMP2436]